MLFLIFSAKTLDQHVLFVSIPFIDHDAKTFHQGIQKE